MTTCWRFVCACAVAGAAGDVSREQETVWLLSDGRPGHFNQAKALVKALSMTRPVRTEWIDMRLRSGIYRNVQRLLLKHSRAVLPAAGLKCFYSYQLPDGIPDYIVSAGGRTSFANAWLARQFAVPNFFIGSLRGLPPALFSAVLTLEPMPAVENNIVMDQPLSVIDQQLLAQLDIPQAWSGQTCWCLLVGGDGSGYRYSEQDWQNLVQSLDALARKNGIRWLISTAPRSGPFVEQVLRYMQGKPWLAELALYSDDADSQIPFYLAAAEKIFVTEDSMTTLGEAVSSGKPVFSLRPGVAGPNKKYSAALQRFVDRRQVMRLQIDELAGASSSLTHAQFSPQTVPPLKKLAEQLVRFL